jgi:hypothetical protein
MPRKQFLIGLGILAAALVALVLVFVGGGGDEVAEVRSDPSTSSSTTEGDAPTTTAPRGPFYPLTGLPVDNQGMFERPLLIVKIDNADSKARPQAGLNQADVVYEEIVEGGVTRFASLFHSRDAEQVGPVRSARSTDILIGTMFGRPLFSFSGANQVFMDRIRASPLIDLSYDWHPQLYQRVPDREAPDDIFTPTQTLFGGDTGEATSPPQLFEWRRGDELPESAVRVPGVDYFTGGAGVPTRFTWDRELQGWKRQQNGTDHVDTADEVIAPDNVIIQFVDYVDTGLTDVAGTPVPEAQLIGGGDALVFTRGHLIRAQWSRPAEGDVTTYTADGDEVRLTPGRTWVALLSPGMAQVTTCAEADPKPAGC